MTREEAEKDFNKAVNCLALELPEAVWNDVHFRWVKLQNTIRETNIEKDKEIAILKTVMIAAAEEINLHWSAHCDSEGYGPSSLMHRLEKGIPSEYGYRAGRFEEMKSETERLKELIHEMFFKLGGDRFFDWQTFKTENNLETLNKG